MGHDARRHELHLNASMTINDRAFPAAVQKSGALGTCKRYCDVLVTYFHLGECVSYY